MKQNVNDKVSHVKLIQDAMREKGWRAADLSRASGVSRGILSKYFNPANEKKMSLDNFFAVLMALGLVNQESKGVGCNADCNPVEKELGEKAVAVLRSKTEYGPSLEMNIRSLYSAVKQKVEADKKAEAQSKAHKEAMAVLQNEQQDMVDRYEGKIKILEEKVDMLEKGPGKKPPPPRKPKGNKNFPSPTGLDTNSKK